MKDQTKTLDLAKAAVNHGLDRGLSAIEVHVDQAIHREVEWSEASSVGVLTAPAKETVTADIRIYSSIGQVGAASGSMGGLAAVERLVQKAIDAATAAPGNPHAGPADQYEQSSIGLGLLDHRYESLDDEQREDAVNENLEDIRSFSGVEPKLFKYSESLHRRAFSSSTGLNRFEEASRFRLDGIVCSANSGIELAASVESRLFADAASLPLGADLAQQVSRYTDPHAPPAEACPIVIEPRVIARIMSAVVPAFDRRAVEAGVSFLSPGRQVGSDKLHLIDDGLVPGGLETRSFDFRGVPSLDIPLIREGAVGALYQSPELARARDGRPSGHEGRGGIWPGNLVLRAGTRSRNMVAPELGRYLILDDLTVSGRGWFNLKSGKLKLTGHMFSTAAGSDPLYIGVHSISTSFIDLWSGIREVMNDQKRFGSVDVSSWVVEGLSLS